MIDAAANDRQISQHTTECYQQTLAEACLATSTATCPHVRANLLARDAPRRRRSTRTLGPRNARQPAERRAERAVAPAVAAGVRGPVTSLLEGLGPAHVDEVPLPVVALGRRRGAAPARRARHLARPRALAPSRRADDAHRFSLVEPSTAPSDARCHCIWRALGDTTTLDLVAVLMICPSCSDGETRVLESRVSDAGEAIRRRRECLDCHARFTTFERLEQSALWVVKRDGSRQPFEQLEAAARPRARVRQAAGRARAGRAHRRGRRGGVPQRRALGGRRRRRSARPRCSICASSTASRTSDLRPSTGRSRPRTSSSASSNRWISTGEHVFARPSSS